MAVRIGRGRPDVREWGLATKEPDVGVSGTLVTGTLLTEIRYSPKVHAINVRLARVEEALKRISP